MTDVEVYQRGEVVVHQPFEKVRAEIEVLKEQIAPGASDVELDLFARVCEQTGLSPFARQIYAIMRYDRRAGREKMVIQTGIDGYRLAADRAAAIHGVVRSEEPTQWCGPDGRWVEEWLSDTPPAAARYTCLKLAPNGVVGRFTATARYAAYCDRTKDGTPTRMWSEKGDVMIAKCAEALALRKAFPAELSGVYVAEEMERQDVATQPMRPAAPLEDGPISQANVEGLTKQVTDAGLYVGDVISAATGGRTEDPAELLKSEIPAARDAFVAMRDAVEPQPDGQVPSGPSVDEDPITDYWRRRVHALLRAKRGALGPDRHAVLAEILGRPVESVNDLTVGDARRVVDTLDGEPDLPAPSATADDGEQQTLGDT